MLIDYERTCCKLRSSNSTLVRVILQVLKEPEIQSKILHRMKNEDTTDAETDAESAAEEAWCPPMPDAPDDPTEGEIAGAADKLETMLRGSHPSVNIFFQPDNLGALPALWLQAKLTISLTSIQDKFARLFMTIAAELWLRGRIDTLETVFQAAARNFTIRLAEALAKYLCSLMRRAETLATPENGMPLVCHLLVSADLVRVDWSSHGKCNRQSRLRSKWPSQSSSHQSTSLTT